MENSQDFKRLTYRDFVVPVILSFIVVISNFYNFLLFHTLAEFFAITVAILLALVAWNMYPFTRNNFLVYLGTGYLWVGILDVMHTLTYKGLSFFAVTGANVGTQFWVTTRYIEAFLLLSAPWFLSHAINRATSLAAYGITAAIVFILIMTGMFPDTYIEGTGLTVFKINSEYAIIFLLMAAAAYLYNQRSLVDARVFSMMMASIVLTMFAEMAFTFYVDIQDFSNIVGHIFKIFSYWLIFLAVIRTTLQEPFAMLSREASTYDAIPDAIVVIDEKGIIRQANRSASSLAKLSVDELIGRNSFDVFHFHGCDKGKCPVFTDDNLDGFSCEGEAEVGGETRWLSYSYSSIGGEYGAHGRVEVIRDVTQRKMAEQKFQRVNALKDSIVENLPMMIFVKDANELKYVEWNKKAEELTGLSKSEALGKDDYDFWPENEVEFFIEKDREVLRERKLLDIPQEPLSTRLGMRTLHTTKIPIYDENGSPQYLLGISEDITERLQIEQALRQSQKMDAMGKLTGGIAHDFNNMLSVVTGFSELLLMQTEGNKTLQGYANEILRAGHRGTKLTNKLLAFTRSKSVDEAQVNLNDVLSDERHMLEKTLTVRIELKFYLADGLWSVRLDSNDLQDAILNISINAMHAMSGSGRLTVLTKNVDVDRSLATELDITTGEYVQLRISDTGIGMDDSTRSHIFDPFFSTKGELGTGLGLSQVYGFVRRSRGGIKVESTPGDGSSFYLYFPREEAEVLDSHRDSVDIESEYAGTESILVVDDESSLRSLMQDLLSNVGYQVATCESGTKALDLLDSKQFQIMISDVLMPGMDGFELAERALQSQPELKIQLVSGYSDNIENTTVDRTLREQILQKPFTRSIFLRTIRERLDTNY